MLYRCYRRLVTSVKKTKKPSGGSPSAAIRLAAFAAAFLTGCLPAEAPSPAAASAAEASRATPEADTPAAGICASFKEQTIRIEIRAWPDGVPDPRCIEVRAEQTMILRNSAAGPIEFALGRLRGTIAPGDSFAAGLTFGEYLLPGAHSLHILPYGGPEIYFKGT
jgi:hypothetical protein